jgi:GH24 family phage-related lysozyme (muramidase)
VVKAVRAKDEGFAKVREAVDKGDEAKLEEGLTGLKGYATPEELASLRPQVYRKLRLENVRKSIDADPFVMREELAKPDFLKRHPDLTRDDMGPLLSRTDAVARRSVGNTVGAFGNELQGEKLTSKDDVVRAYGGSAPAHVVGMMQEQFTKRHDPEQQRLRRTPEYQKQVSGEAGRMLDGLVLAGGVDFEKGYTSASFAISEMDDGPAKNYQTGKLKAALAGVRFRPQGREQSAFAKLDNFIAVENGKGKPMVRVRITDPASGAVSYGARKPFGEVRPELMHAEDEDAAISKQMEADARAGWLYDELSAQAGMYKNGLEDASDGDVEKMLTGLHRELTGRMRDAEKAVPVLPEGVRPAGRNLQEVVGSFYAGRGAAAGQEGGEGDADRELASQLKDARAKVDAAVSLNPHVFNEHERDALASFTQGQGVERLHQLLDDGKRAKPDIADSMLRYRNKDGRRSPELSRRREEERSLFLLGYGQGA